MPKTIERFCLTIEKAAPNLEISAATLSKRLKAAGIDPNDDGKFWLADLVRAAVGDLRGEQTRLAKESADAKALENEKSRGRLLDAEQVYKHYEGVFVTLRQKTLASSMTDNEKDELLNDLRGLKNRIYAD